MFMQFFRLVLQRQLVTLMLLSGLCGIPVLAHAITENFCARVESRNDDNPYLKTLRVTIDDTGQQVEPSLRSYLYADLVAEVLARDGAQLKVFLEPLGKNNCLASGDNTLQLNVSLSEAEALAANSRGVRGEAERRSAEIQALAAKTQSIVSLTGTEQENKLTLRIFTATNRKATGSTDSKTAFGNQVTALTYGSVEVEVKAQAAMRDIETPNIIRFHRVTDLKDVAVSKQFTKLSLEEWRAEVNARAASHDKAGILLFVHGFKNDFVDAAAVAGQLTYDMGVRGATVMFSWPSQNALFDYRTDGKLAEKSVAAMESLLQTLTKLPDNVPIYIVAHSMGNRVVLAGMQQTAAAQEGPAPRSGLQGMAAAAGSGAAGGLAATPAGGS